MASKQYNIDELSELTGYSRRTIRYYVQEGIIEPPAGRGRGGFYNDSHLNKLLYIKSLQGQGLNLAAITKLLHSDKINNIEYSRDVWIRHEIIPGLEISVSRDLEEKESKKIFEIIKVAKALLKEKTTNE